MNFDYLYKIVIVGDSGVGKTSLLTRYFDDQFNHNFISTIGVDFKFCHKEVGDSTIKLQCWDTAGNERFRSIVRSYYRGASAVLLCFDITNHDSFSRLSYWKNELDRYLSENAIIVLIGTKCDMNDMRRVSFEEISKYSADQNYPYFETSSKNNIGIDATFNYIMERLLHLSKTEQRVYRQRNPLRLTNSAKIQQEKKDCCVIL